VADLSSVSNVVVGFNMSGPGDVTAKKSEGAGLAWARCGLYSWCTVLSKKTEISNSSVSSVANKKRGDGNEYQRLLRGAWR